MTAPTPDLREALTAALPYWVTDRLEDSQVRGVVDIVLAVLQPALAAERERCALVAGETLARLLAPASYERAVKDAIRALPPSAGDR